MSSQTSDFWSQTSGICTIVRLVLGTIIPAAALCLTWLQFKQMERVTPDPPPCDEVDENASDGCCPNRFSGKSNKHLGEKMHHNNRKSRFLLIVLLIAAAVSFNGAVAVATSIPSLRTAQ
jgi:hypothetical protein